MFMNLDTLPVGKSYYTVYVTLDPKGTPRLEMSADEVDVVAPSSASRDEVVNECAAEIVSDYGTDARVVGVVNQSDGYVVYDAFTAGDEG
jgi:hypothetical protein